MHQETTVREALRLSGQGLADSEVARRLRLPRTTICNWRRHGGPTGKRPSPVQTPPRSRPLDERAYAYLLGMYLGDGWISHHGRTSALSFKLDARYPGVIRECATAITRSLDLTVRAGAPSRGSVRLWAYAPDLPTLFPQHGPGRKHERGIALEPWQREITGRFPGELLRGLIHSDGSRSINRFAVRLPSGRVARYAYPRYFLTNLSADIRAIFCEHCELMGIRWTLSNPRNVSVANRAGVALLDSLRRAQGMSPPEL
jgi:hypothetical protein